MKVSISRRFVPLAGLVALVMCGCPNKTDEQPAPVKPAQPAANPNSPAADPKAPAEADASQAEEAPGTPRTRREKPPAPIEKKQVRRTRNRPSGAQRDEALNMPPIARYVADRLNFVGSIVTFRVTAEPGDYFNCYYKGKTHQYRHLRLRGDGAAWLDAYVPRDDPGERLWVRVQKRKDLRLTVRVILRPNALSSVCVGQVEVLDFEEGWNYERGGLAEPGALKRRLANNMDRVPAKNRPALATFLEMRRRYIDQAVAFKVRGRLDRYYQCRYRDAERTHYALYLLCGDFCRS